ncbi:hypothetical protein [Planctomicrobium sp. SH527]|uniref:hypothetical protein n=1 Tax=Planctomicrobium sp. SH527 TaxID=3448123 RepID=UPI003F5C1A6A
MSCPYCFENVGVPDTEFVAERGRKEQTLKEKERARAQAIAEEKEREAQTERAYQTQVEKERLHLEQQFSIGNYGPGVTPPGMHDRFSRLWVTANALQILNGFGMGLLIFVSFIAAIDERDATDPTYFAVVAASGVVWHVAFGCAKAMAEIANTIVQKR